MGSRRFLEAVRLVSVTTAQRDALTVADGDVIYNSTLQLMQVRAGGVWVAYARSLKDDAGASYSNSVTETTLFAGSLYDIPANSLAVGDLLEIIVFGTYLNNSGAGRDITFRTYFDAVEASIVFSGVANVITASATARPFEYRASIRVGAIGASGSVKSNSLLWVGGPGGVGANVINASVAKGATTIDTTQALTVDVKSTLSAATSTQTVDCEGICIRKTPAP